MLQSPTSSPTASLATSAPTPSPTGSPTENPTVRAPTIVVEVLGTLTFDSVDCTKNYKQDAAFISVIEDVACDDDDNAQTTCTGEITSITCTEDARRLRDLASRRMQTSTLRVEYKVVINAICSLAGCYNDVDGVQAVANAVYNGVVAQLNAAISGFVAALGAANSDLAAVLTGTIASGDFDPVVVPILAFLSDYYPDWQKGSGTCLNDNQMPLYMKLTGSYLEKTLKACCQRFFGWDIATCMGTNKYDLTGFYPSWGTADVKCLNATAEVPPVYMQNNPTAWLIDDLEDCCERYYNWDKEACLVESSGGTAAAVTGSGDWWVDWENEECVKDCPKDTADPKCGGLAKPWDALYDNANSCCDRLAWVERSECTL